MDTIITRTSYLKYSLCIFVILFVNFLEIVIFKFRIEQLEIVKFYMPSRAKKIL